MAARIGHKMGLFKRLVNHDRPLTTSEITCTLGGGDIIVGECLLLGLIHLNIVWLTCIGRLIKFMASLQMVDEVDVHTWKPSVLTPMLAKDEVQGWIYLNSNTLGPTWIEFPDWLESTQYKRTYQIKDTAFSRARGGDFEPFEFYRDNPEHFKNFHMAMTVHRFGNQRWYDYFPFAERAIAGADPTRPLFVDVGGGRGHQCEALLGKYPDIAGRVILQDLEGPISEAPQVEGMQKQVIDILKAQPVEGARTYYLRSVLHDWPDNQCLTILNHLRAAMTENSMLLIDEMVVPDKGAHKIAMQMDMTMLANLVSEERSESRWRAILASAEFEVEYVHTYVPEVGNSTIVAVPSK